MGESKLNEVSKVTTINTGDSVVLNTSAGKTVQILKADLANALAEVFPAVIARYMKIGSSVVDLNTAHQGKDPGLYVSLIVSDTLNRPVGLSVGCLLMSIRYTKNNVSPSQLIMQIIHSAAAIICRIGQGNGTDITWREWCTIYE